ncbi:MAG: hypothetical protein C3F07_08305 [Anaerolineales bacterium]|nr:hypothetical protein [Anaerolineae bacterium]PWB74168.1 MAG: hypothetical protein C3F07_08305 [Anaerolineales bacterium]
MKPTRTGAISGCLIWFIVFGILGSCLVPAGMMIGGFTSVTDFAMQTLEPLICPDGTTAKSRSYATTTNDEFGNPQPSTAYVMQCIDANGDVIKEDPVVYSFVWIGIVSGIGLILAGFLAFALAAPAGVLIGRLKNRDQKEDYTKNIEPR